MNYGTRFDWALASVGLYLLLVPLVAVAWPVLGGHDLARVVQVALGGLCAARCLWPSGECRGAAVRLGGTLLLLVLGGLALASVLHAAEPAMALREVTLLLGAVSVAAAAASARDANRILGLMSSYASAAYVAVVLLLVAALLITGQALDRKELIVGYINYRFFNHVQSASLPLAVLVVTVAHRRTWHWNVGWIAAIGGFALLFAVAGRGTMVGIAVGAVAVAGLFGRTAFPILRNLAIAVAFGLVLLGFLFWLLPMWFGAPQTSADEFYGTRLGSVEMRMYLWRIALSYVEQAPWLGIGPMHYAHHPTGDAAHPHNIYLQIAAEWGLPMLVTVSVLAVLALRRLTVAVRRCEDTRERSCGIGLVFACVAIAVDGLFSGNFVMPVSQVWIAFTFGWAAAWLAKHRPAEPDARLPVGAAAIFNGAAVIALVASQLWLVWSIWPEVRQMDEHLRQAMERVPTATMNPRFWSHGWF